LWNLLFFCTSTHRGESFLFLAKFYIFGPSEKSRGDKKKRQFLAKKIAAGRKNDFFTDFSLLSRRNNFVPFSEIMKGQKKRQFSSKENRRRPKK